MMRKENILHIINRRSFPHYQTTFANKLEIASVKFMPQNLERDKSYEYEIERKFCWQFIVGNVISKRKIIFRVYSARNFNRHIFTFFFLSFFRQK
jgi:hypothetical protein